MQKIDERASRRWLRADKAYRHYAAYIETKRRRYDLTFIDLVYVRNFKGGSAVVAEAPETLPPKLRQLSRYLTEADASGDFAAPLGRLRTAERLRARNRMVGFLETAVAPQLAINGFGPSFASALLHFYFPLVVPILDRRGLNGAAIPGVKTNGQGQVMNLVDRYPPFIDYCARVLREERTMTLRELDRRLFCKPIRAKRTEHRRVK